MKNFYKENLEKHGDDVKSLGWGSTFSQEKRFEALLRLGISDKDSLIDIGCGFCDFYTFAKNNNVTLDYCGIEIFKPIYDKAIKKHKENLSKEFKILNANYKDSNIKSLIKKDYDWAIASGVFCFDDKENNDNTKLISNISKMFDLVKKGLGINFLSLKTNNKVKKGFKHYDPDQILKLIKKNITTEVKLVDDYLHNDFTIFLYKKDTYK